MYITRLSLSYCILVVKTGKNSRSVTSIKKCIRIFLNYLFILSLLYSNKFFLSRTLRKRLFFGPKPLKSGKISPTVSYIRKWVRIFFVYFLILSILYSYKFFVSFTFPKRRPMRPLFDGLRPHGAADFDQNFFGVLSL